MSLFIGPILLLVLSCQGIMLVYNVTDEKSFEDIKMWMRDIEKVSRMWTGSPVAQ